MKDVVYCASLVVTMMSGYFHRDDEVEDYLARYNEEFPERGQLYARFLETASYIDQLGLPQDSRAFKKADFYTLFAEVDRRLNLLRTRPVAEEASALLSRFYLEVDEARSGDAGDTRVSTYLATILQNTADRGARIARGEVIQLVLGEAAQKPFELDRPDVDESSLDAELAAAQDASAASDE